MSETIVQPTSEAELIETVRAHRRIIAVGNRTKPAMVGGSDAIACSMQQWSGIVEYEPSEFIVTVRAGTRIDQVCELLAEQNQYLPFDPMLIDAGATVGGTIASGLSGPGRFRFGGVRDFVIGVSLVLGNGDLVHAGGKVVKNAAGFDVPKWMVGSMGRLGVISTVTLKVFPKPLATMTLAVACESIDQMRTRTGRAAASRWELDAIDASEPGRTLYLRLAGPPQVNQAIASEIGQLWGEDVSVLENDQTFWRTIGELDFAPHRSHVVKVPTTDFGVCEDWGVDYHTSIAGNVAWVATDDVADLDNRLAKLGLCGLIVRGDAPRAVLGRTGESEVAKKLKQAMDPDGRFPEN